MIINSIAFLTSTFNISPKIVTDKQRFFASESWYFIFNDGDCYITVDLAGVYYDADKTKQTHFWPFVKFTHEDGTNTFEEQQNFNPQIFYRTAFRGIFPDYDYTEFFFYSLLIFGIPILRKKW